MAIQKITYAAKSRGDLWQSSDANELKQVINNNADELSSLQQSMSEWFGQPPLTPVETETSTTKLITPNVLHVWTEAVASLTITLDDGVSGMMNEYMMEFTVGSATFKMNLPTVVRWLEEPEWEEGYTYHVSIVNNLALYAGWANQTAQ